MLAHISYTIGFSTWHLGVYAVLLVVLWSLRGALQQSSGRGPLALVGVLLLSALLLSTRLAPAPDQLGLALGLGIACLLLSIALSLRGWMFRRRVWLTEPERLAETPPPPTILVSLGTLLLLGTLVLSLSAPGTWWATIACLAGGIGGCVLGHLSMRVWVAGLGLWTIGCGVGLMFLAGGWMPIVALTIASGYMLWLSGFWDQQLLGGSGWTTTGRLIPWARFGAVLGSILVAHQLAILALSGWSGWEGWFGLLLVFVLVLLLFKDGLTGFFIITPAASWLLVGSLFCVLLGPEALGWATLSEVTTPAVGDGVDLVELTWQHDESAPGVNSFFYLTPGFALGGLVLIGRRVLRGQREPVSSAGNQILLPMLAFADMAFAPLGWVPWAWALPVMALDLFTNRPPALAETSPAVSNP